MTENVWGGRQSHITVKRDSIDSIQMSADNLNNLMASVVGNISLARMELEPGSNAEKYLAAAEKACILTKAVANQFVQFSAIAGDSDRALSVDEKRAEALGSVKTAVRAV